MGGKKKYAETTTVLSTTCQKHGFHSAFNYMATFIVAPLGIEIGY